MTPLAETISFKLYADGAMTAKQLSQVVAQPIEYVYGALAELENADRVRIYAKHRMRLWESNDRHSRAPAHLEAA